MDWNGTTLLLVTGIVGLGSVLQAATGLGAGLIIIPLLAIVSLDLVPGPVMLASMSLSSVMAYRGREHIEFTFIKPVVLGLVVGTIVAAAFVSVMDISQLGLVFGLFILLAVVISIRSPKLVKSAKDYLFAGVVSGLMGTSTGIGAPVLAMAYQNHSGPCLRATLAFLYLISSFVMLLLLNLAGRFGGEEFKAGLLLMPGFIMGYFIAPRLVQFIDGGYARKCVLLISTVSAISLIVQSLMAMF